jgi:hypothetical protein
MRLPCVRPLADVRQARPKLAGMQRQQGMAEACVRQEEGGTGEHLPQRALRCGVAERGAPDDARVRLLRSGAGLRCLLPDARELLLACAPLLARGLQLQGTMHST